MISFIKNILHRKTCKHQYICIGVYKYYDYSGLPVYVEMYKCCKCGKHKKVKRW